jgi:hypothetical protein
MTGKLHIFCFNKKYGSSLQCRPMKAHTDQEFHGWTYTGKTSTTRRGEHQVLSAMWLNDLNHPAMHLFSSRRTDLMECTHTLLQA